MMAFEPKLYSKPVMKINKEFYSKNKVVVRRLESYVKKIINKKWAVIFNRACMRENIYIYILEQSRYNRYSGIILV